jgi:hypothetical protein
MTDGHTRNAGPRSSAVLIALLAALALPAAAGAASPPSLSTGPARQLSYSSVTLTGSINPRGQDTTYFFQYGPTRAYGSQTGLADAGAGSKAVHVSLSVGGLQPVSRYHYRLIAVNATGASTGGDGTFTTTAVPLSLQILAAPNPVPFGGSATVQGTLSGTGNGNRAVVLQANPFPYTQGFANLGNPQLTNSTGTFAFPVLGLAQATQFRVVTAGSPLVASPVIIEGVTVRVSAHVARTRRRHYARIYGTVTPAEDGMQIGILKVSHGRYVLVAGTILRHGSASSSRFSRVVHVTSGIYRVLARVTDGAHSSAYGAPLRIG